MDSGEELQRHGNTEIRLEKYQQQVDKLKFKHFRMRKVFEISNFTAERCQSVHCQA